MRVRYSSGFFIFEIMKIRKNIIVLLLLLYGVGLQAQVWSVGVYGGESSPLRNKESYYNYTNEEGGAFIRYNKPIKKEYGHSDFSWISQVSVYAGEYNFEQENKKQKTFRANFSTGVQYNLYKAVLWEVSIQGLLGAGYNSGYYLRLAKGFNFKEEIALNIQLMPNHHFAPYVEAGYMHNSNANIYKLNRGFEVVFIRMGVAL